MSTHLRRLILVVLTVSLFSATMAQLAFASPNVRVDLRVLLMTGNAQEEEFKAWMAILDRAGVPYDTFVTTSQPDLTPDVLSGGGDHAKYQAVILSTSSLAFCSGTSPCVETFSAEEWAVLDDYQTRFGIRRISGNTYPTAAYGLQAPSFAGDISGQRANLTPAGLSVFGALAGPVDMGIGTFGWYAAPDPAATFTTLLAGPAGSPAGTALIGIHTRPDGLEQAVMTMAMGSSSLHSFLLGRGLLDWATRGIYLGFERAYFSVDVDDIFLSNDRWDVGDNTTWEDNCVTNPCIRMTPADVTRAVNWQTSSGITLTMAFNAFGTEEWTALYGSDPLADALLANQAEFRWLNHTWTHTEFDSATLPPLTQKEMIEEVRFNTNWARERGLPINPRELVTGSHSGLTLPDMEGVLTATGIKYIAADNSRTPEPFLIGTTSTLPRHPSNVYYNVGTMAEQLDEYNYIFLENCTNTTTTTCFTQPADQATYIDNEATVMLSHILGNDPRPHYVHQANLAEDGVFYFVADEVLARYNIYMATPIVQQNYRESIATIQRGNAWATDGDQVDAYYQNGRIYLTSPTDTRAPITGVPNGELYGGQRSLWVTLGQNVTTIIDLGGFTWPTP